MSTKPEPLCTLDEMAKEMLEELEGQNDPGFTAGEYAGKWGVSKGTAQRMIKGLIDKGKIIVGQRYTRDAANRRISVPVYLLKKNDKERR